INLQAYVKGEPEAIQNKSIGRGTFSAVTTFTLEYE
ncbi:MAG: fimbrial protein, partial [Serratia proteamaculans]